LAYFSFRLQLPEKKEQLSIASPAVGGPFVNSTPIGLFFLSTATASEEQLSVASPAVGGPLVNSNPIGLISFYTARQTTGSNLAYNWRTVSKLNSYWLTFPFDYNTARDKQLPVT
jgi:hypothetical protein